MGSDNLFDELCGRGAEGIFGGGGGGDLHTSALSSFVAQENSKVSPSSAPDPPAASLQYVTIYLRALGGHDGAR